MWVGCWVDRVGETTKRMHGKAGKIEREKKKEDGIGARTVSRPRLMVPTNLAVETMAFGIFFRF